jgi:hypothetical protein
MLDPAPTTKLDPTLTRGTLAEVRPATATQPAFVVLTIPNTDYRLHLCPHADDLARFEGREGTKVVGIIRVPAKRLDICGTGGRFVEPCFGRPRRVQGMVRAVLKPENVVVVGAANGLSLHLTPTAPGQTAAQFAEGDFLTCGVLDGASFELLD